MAIFSMFTMFQVKSVEIINDEIRIVFYRLFIKLRSFDVSNWSKVDNYLPRMSIMAISDTAYSDNAMKNTGAKQAVTYFVY
jgi:hypothetical protein